MRVVALVVTSVGVLNLRGVDGDFFFVEQTTAGHAGACVAAPVAVRQVEAALVGDLEAVGTVGGLILVGVVAGRGKLADGDGARGDAGGEDEGVTLGYVVNPGVGR